MGRQDSQSQTDERSLRVRLQARFRLSLLLGWWFTPRREPAQLLITGGLPDTHMQQMGFETASERVTGHELADLPTATLGVARA